MNQKLLILGLTALLIAPIAFGFNVTVTNRNMTAEKGDLKTSQIEVTNLNQTISPTAEDTGNITVIFLPTSLASEDASKTTSGTISIYFHIPPDVSYGRRSVPVTLGDEVVDFSIDIPQPTYTLLNRDISEGKVMVISGSEFELTKVTDTGVKLDNILINQSGHTMTVGGKEVTVTPTHLFSDYDTAGIEVTSNTKLDVSVRKKKQPPKRLIIKRMEGETMKRDDRFYFRVVENVTGSDVKSANVIFTDMSDGNVVGRATSDSWGIGSIMVEKDISGNRVKVTVEKSGYNGTSKVYEFPVSYSEFRKGYTLTLKGTPGEILEGESTGMTVETMKGDTIGATVEVIGPSGEKETVVTKSGEFEFSFNKSGKYEFEPKKADYYSNVTTINVIKDADRDNIRNSKDKCPNKEGIKRNNGCPKIGVKIEVLGKKGKRVDEDNLEKGSDYTVRLLSEDSGETLNYTGSITIEDMNYTVEGGTLSFSPAEAKDYTMKIPGTKTTETTEFGLTVRKKGGWVSGNQALLLGLGGVAVFLVVVFVLVNRGGGGGRIPKFGLPGKTEKEAPPGAKRYKRK